MDNKPFDFENRTDGGSGSIPTSDNELLNRLLSESEADVSGPKPSQPEPISSQTPSAGADGAPVAPENPAVETPPQALPPDPAGEGMAQPEEPPVTEDEDLPEEKPKPGMGCLSTFSYCILILGISVLLAAFAILAANDMFALVKTEKEATVEIEDGATLREVADALADGGVIRYPSLFWAFAKMTDMDNQILPGTYTLNASMDYRSLLSKIKYRPDTKRIVTVTIPEGMEQDDIFALLEANGVCEAYRLQAYAKYYDFSYSFLKNLPYSDKRLEGYLFPDTYDFYIGEAPERVLKKFLSNFNRKWDVDLKARAENIDMSIREVMIIASMIEREAKYDDERPTISSVIHNRLRSDSFPHLQIDATVQYALPEWKETLTSEDLKIDSPYNTYLCEGLPIGPISNPGLAAIRAALYPEETNYYYYVARKNGWHYFAATNAEHEENVRRAAEEDASAAFSEENSGSAIPG